MIPQRKHGQMHLTETTLVLFFIIIIILVSIVFYYRYSITRIDSLGEELSERDASILLSKTTHLDLLSCNNRQCLDTAKFLPFIEMNTDKHIRHIFGEKTIRVIQTYPVLPEQTQQEHCTTNHYIHVSYPNNCGTWELYDHNPGNTLGRVVSTPISIYFPEIDTYRIGRLEITHYGKIN